MNRYMLISLLLTLPAIRLIDLDSEDERRNRYARFIRRILLGAALIMAAIGLTRL